MLCVAKDVSKTAHAVEASVEREGGIEACHFARERDALTTADVGGVGEEQVETFFRSKMFFAIFFVAPVLARELDGEFFLQISCVFPSGAEGLRRGIGGFDDGSLCFAK